MSLRDAATPNDSRRRAGDRLMRAVLLAALLVAVVPLVLIIGYVLVMGGRSIANVAFFTETYRPPVAVGAGLADPALSEAVPDPNDPFANLDPATLAGTGADAAGANAGVQPGSVVAQGGVLHGIIGTLLISGAALLMALPIGLLAGIFLSEFGQYRIATVVRFCCDVLSGAPSIVVGVVAYILLVQRFREFSGLAGSVALMVLMVPTITRTTEEMLKLVPQSIREAALALGAPAWYATFRVVMPAALGGIVTGVLLAFARGAGETAPLLLTILGNNNLSFDLLKPIAALPLLIYNYTGSPFPSEVNLAWGTAFVLMVMVLAVNILVRLATRGRWGR